MSGIEVVGLVLAAIPLVISGLEHYSEGVETIRRVRDAPAELRSVAIKLRAENIVFRNTLEILLQDSVDMRMQQALLHDVAGEAWADAAVEKALRRRLQHSYPSYIEHVKLIHKELADITQKLHLENGKVSWRVLLMDHVWKEASGGGDRTHPDGLMRWYSFSALT